MSDKAESLQFSIVIPVYNEAENIEPMVREIQAAFDGRAESYEVIFVDDASSDVADALPPWRIPAASTVNPTENAARAASSDANSNRDRP